MRVAINGAGVAGPTLGWWLRRYGHEVVLYEKAPVLRTGGYVIDFWGVGYDVAERMGILPALQEKGYRIERLEMVNGRGRVVSEINVASIRSMVKDRFFSIPRGDIAATIYQACGDVETRFGCSVAGIEPRHDAMIVKSSDGSEEAFDLVVGADGLHSQVRSLVFGPEGQLEHDLGYYVSVFALRGYEPRDERAYVSYTVPKRQVARVSLREGVTMFMFIFRADAPGARGMEGSEPRAVLREVFKGMEWETQGILERMGEAEQFYFDRVSQIRMKRWTEGRVALVGDAAACASLLAGEGTGLAMAEAYVLAGELHRAGKDWAGAFAHYENKLRPMIETKQRGALRFAGFFAPKNRWGSFLRGMAIRAWSVPGMARWLVGDAVRDEFRLPEYRIEF